MEGRKIQSFTDLRAWQEAHKLALDIYKHTGHFPASEKFGLASQLRRSISSVTANIAEGFGRSSKNDREHFYVMASSSLYETKSHLLLARDLNYIPASDIDSLEQDVNRAHKTLNALIKVHKASNV